jgi:hypothetical protein
MFPGIDEAEKSAAPVKENFSFADCPVLSPVWRQDEGGKGGKSGMPFRLLYRPAGAAGRCDKQGTTMVPVFLQGRAFERDFLLVADSGRMTEPAPFAGRGMAFAVRGGMRGMRRQLNLAPKTIGEREPRSHSTNIRDSAQILRTR